MFDYNEVKLVLSEAQIKFNLDLVNEWLKSARVVDNPVAVQEVMMIASELRGALDSVQA